MPMLIKCFYLLFFISLRQCYAQESKLFRIYEDNDLINIRGKGTDRGYTNGTRFDFFYFNNKQTFYLYKLMPKAGKSSINTYGWSIMQTIITPEDITNEFPAWDDYYYSGALFMSHSLHSSSQDKNFTIQSEWVLGMSGPLSFAAQTQTFIHHITGSRLPQGWGHQIPTDLLFNYNLNIEKQYINIKNKAQLIAGGQLYAGTMRDGMSLYTTIRLGKMNSYFDGLIKQYNFRDNHKKNLHFYIVAKPAIEWTLYNALLQGGLFNKKSPFHKKNSKKVEQWVKQLEIGFVIASGNWGISATQKISSSPLPLQSFHKQQMVGNITIFHTW